MSRPVIEIPSMIHEAIDEETIANYNPNYYFSAHTGQVLERQVQYNHKTGMGVWFYRLAG